MNRRSNSSPKKSSSKPKRMTRKAKQLLRDRLRGHTHQQETLAQRLSGFHFEVILTATSEGTALITSLREAVRITLAAETAYLMKVKKSEEAQKKYGDPGQVKITDLQADARVCLLELAADEVVEAEQRVIGARDQIEKIQRDLKILFKTGTEADDSLEILLQDMELQH